MNGAAVFNFSFMLSIDAASQVSSNLRGSVSRGKAGDAS